MTGWTTLAHQTEVPPDWRERLGRRLDQRLRRIGSWAELALYGARACLDLSGEERLPAGAMLCVSCHRGPVEATQRALVQRAERGLPMPFTFLQSQPGQVLAALCQSLHWSGDARCVLGRDPQRVLALAQLEAGPAGLLFGYVDEGPVLRSEWWRMVAAPEA